MYIGNGRLDAIAVKGPFTLGDTTQACMALQWSPQPVRGEKQTVQRHNATVTIDANGAAGSKLLITLTVERKNFTGDALADLTYVISGAAAKVDWSSTDFTASATASAATLKDVIDLINQIDGFKAWALHAPHNLSVNTGYFIDLAETALKTGVGVEGRSDVLHRDVSESVIDTDKKVLFARISLPEERDANAFELLKIQGSCTGNTSGVVKLYRDNISEYGSDGTGGEVYVNETLATALTKYVDNKVDEAPVLRGPCILQVSASDLSVAEFSVQLKQASIGA